MEDLVPPFPGCPVRSLFCLLALSLATFAFPRPILDEFLTL